MMPSTDRCRRKDISSTTWTNRSKFVTLRGLQWVLLEERDNYIPQISIPLYTVSKEILPVIVVAPIPKNLSASEEALQVFQNIFARRPLHHRELWAHLPSKGHHITPVDRATETALSIDEPDDPSDAESFLLIVRTPHIVTAHVPHRTEGY